MLNPPSTYSPKRSMRVDVDQYGNGYLVRFLLAFAGGKQWVETANKTFSTIEQANRQAGEWSSLPAFLGA